MADGVVMTNFENLFSKGTIGSLELKNRIIMPAMEPGLADSRGNLDGEASAAYYGLRARGGAGLIITGNVAIEPNGRAAAVQPGLWSDEHIPAWKEVTKAVHDEGGKIFIQLSHAGREVHPLLGWEAVGPSAIPSPVLRSRPRELTVLEIEQLVEKFGQAAKRAIEAGADGVEIHGGHGYLICQFLSPNMNKRDDDYGRTLAGRAKFAIEVVQSIRKAIGPDVPLSFRLSADEMIEDGIKIHEGCDYAGIIEEAGADIINVSACNYESAFYNLPSYYLEEGCFIDLARAVKKDISVPVATVGRIRSPQMAEDAISTGAADFVCMGRTLIADPFLPEKVRQGKQEEVRPCLSCNKCIDSLSMGPLVCAVNSRLRDECWPREKGSEKSKIFVAGSGPAGLTAAYDLAWQGNDVTLFEGEEQLGGKLTLAAMPPRKHPIGEFRDWLIGEAKRAGVQIKEGERLAGSTVKEENPDHVIVATGSASSKPPFTVHEGTALYSVHDGFTAPERLGENVVIIGGGGEGAELADFLSEGGQKVTLLEMKRKVALDLLPMLRFFLLRRLEEKGVEVIPRFKVQEVGPGYVLGKRGKKGMDRLEGFSSIVVATGLRPLRSLADDMELEERSFQTVGDASEPRSILEAVREGAEAARAWKQKE